ncbi:hypothetical protein LEN26_019436 [Aphanomyces euteiches]|nr:hypothetical protein LEN26_019436 [Aphanomyces euteiches]KAH9103706.1 hypothetical protein AeMF1_020020 [Aphanomyces euteiches]
MWWRALVVLLAVVHDVFGVPVVVFPNGKAVGGRTIDLTPDQFKSRQALAAYLSTIAALDYHGDRVYKASGELVESFDQLVEDDHLYVVAPGMELLVSAPVTQVEEEVSTQARLTFINKYDFPVDVYWFQKKLYPLDKGETQAFRVHHDDEIFVQDAAGNVLFEHHVNVHHSNDLEFTLPGGISIEFRNQFESDPVDIYWFDRLHGKVGPKQTIVFNSADGNEFTLRDSRGNHLAKVVLHYAYGPHQHFAVPLDEGHQEL